MKSDRQKNVPSKAETFPNFRLGGYSEITNPAVFDAAASLGTGSSH
jgi:hypothetical protein